MTTVEKALEAILEAVQPVGFETVSLVAAFGRILGEKVVAPRDHPPCDNAAMVAFFVAELLSAQGSRMLTSMERPIVLPEASEGARAGEPISVELFRDLMEDTGGGLL